MSVEIDEPLVTIALPVRNGADTVESVVRSVLDQDYRNIELLVSDNASTDATEHVVRRLAMSDDRIRYHRQPRNIGLIDNFEWAKRHARGRYVRWIGDNDSLHPGYVSRCVAEFEKDPRLVLVTTQLEYRTNDGAVQSHRYDSPELRSDDPLVRLEEWLRLLNDNYQYLDPLYGMARTEVVQAIEQDRMLRGDEVYAVKMVLAGPWGHVPEVLGLRPWTGPRPRQVASLLGVPAWHTLVRDARQTRAMLRVVEAAPLPPQDRRRARAAVLRLYGARHWANARRRGRRLRAELGKRRPSRPLGGQGAGAG